MEGAAPLRCKGCIRGVGKLAYGVSPDRWDFIVPSYVIWIGGFLCFVRGVSELDLPAETCSRQPDMQFQLLLYSWMVQMN